MKRKSNAANQYLPSIYDKNAHPLQLIELFEKGKGACDFCAVNNISKPTFYNWLEAHPEFNEAYLIAQQKGEAWLTDQGLRGMWAGQGFNATVFSIMMRNRCDMPEHRRVRLHFKGCKTSMERVKVLEEKIASGEFSAVEINHLASYIKSVAEINEKTEIAKQVEELMKMAGKA